MIHLIVGNTGSGKTTYANRLKEKTKGIIFSIDKWNKTLFLPDKRTSDGLDWFLERIERVEEMILSLILQLESNETDSILDLGLSKIEHREKFRKFAEKNKLEIKLHFLDVSKTTRMKRVLQRNEEKGITFEFEVSKENFEFMESWFERPSKKELEKGIIISEKDLN
jgi:predicted kinase